MAKVYFRKGTRASTWGQPQKGEGRTWVRECMWGPQRGKRKIMWCHGKRWEKGAEPRKINESENNLMIDWFCDHRRQEMSSTVDGKLVSATFVSLGCDTMLRPEKGFLCLCVFEWVCVCEVESYDLSFIVWFLGGERFFSVHNTHPWCFFHHFNRIEELMMQDLLDVVGRPLWAVKLRFVGFCCERQESFFTSLSKVA